MNRRPPACKAGALPTELRAPWKIISITGLASGHYILESPNKPTDCSVLSFQLKGYEDGASSADLEFGLRGEDIVFPDILERR